MDGLRPGNQIPETGRSWGLLPDRLLQPAINARCSSGSVGSIVGYLMLNTWRIVLADQTQYNQKEYIIIHNVFDSYIMST
jgi:hypothetical protein